MSVMTAQQMSKQFLVITVLAAALLFSQGGNLLVAALCPHFQSGMSSCETKPSDASMSDEEMGHTEHRSDMEMEPELASYPSTDSATLGQTNDRCSHCAVHSSTTSNRISSREGEAPTRSVDLSILRGSSHMAPIAVSQRPISTSRAHGPPGGSIPRHILINTFRI